MKYGWATLQIVYTKRLLSISNRIIMRIKHFSLTSATILRKFRFTLHKNTIIDVI